MKRLFLIALAIAVGGCAEPEEMEITKPPAPVISEISESHVKIQSSGSSWAEIEQVARHGCALYQRLPVYISTQCGAFGTHPTPPACAGAPVLPAGVPGVASLNYIYRLACQQQLNNQRMNPICVRDDHLFACKDQ